MKDSATLDETDLALVHALQIEPRASWTLIGRALGTSPVTAARRWDRLTHEGLAWVTAYPNATTWVQHRCVALVEVDCEPVQRRRVIEALTADPRVASVEQVSGGLDLFLSVFVLSLGALSRFVLGRLTPLEGIRSTRTRIVTRAYSEANQWRLDVLTPAQQALLAPPRPQPSAGDGVLEHGDRELLRALSLDGRQSVADLAALTAVSPSTVSRRLARLRREQLISLRCEVAQELTGWPVLATYWARVPAEALERTARSLSTLLEIRMCTAVTGASNLIMSVWLRSLADSQRLELLLARELPDLTLTDRAITLQTDMRMGRVLDSAGRGIGAVPIDPWAEPEAGETVASPSITPASSTHV
jgi:DNA-binding Lrp family transcriptional regulator